MKKIVLSTGVIPAIVYITLVKITRDAFTKKPLITPDNGIVQELSGMFKGFFIQLSYKNGNFSLVMKKESTPFLWLNVRNIAKGIINGKEVKTILEPMFSFTLPVTQDVEKGLLLSRFMEAYSFISGLDSSRCLSIDKASTSEIESWLALCIEQLPQKFNYGLTTDELRTYVNDNFTLLLEPVADCQPKETQRQEGPVITHLDVNRTDKVRICNDFPANVYME